MMHFCLIFLSLFIVLSCSGNKGAEGAGSEPSQLQSSVLSNPLPGLTQSQTQNNDGKNGGDSSIGDPGKKDDSEKKDEAKGAPDEAAYRLITE